MNKIAQLVLALGLKTISVSMKGIKPRFYTLFYFFLEKLDSFFVV